jgi:hypothetical protein
LLSGVCRLNFNAVKQVDGIKGKWVEKKSAYYGIVLVGLAEKFIKLETWIL